MLILLGQRDRGLLGAHAHLHAAGRRVDREIAIAQPADQVEGRPRGLLARKAQRVVRHGGLDRCTHLGR
jgi:hypothetical protein